MKKIKFIKLPYGARFKYRKEDESTYCVLERHGQGLICKHIPDPENIPNVHMQEIFSVAESNEILLKLEVYLVS